MAERVKVNVRGQAAILRRLQGRLRIENEVVLEINETGGPP